MENGFSKIRNSVITTLATAMLITGTAEKAFPQAPDSLGTKAPMGQDDGAHKSLEQVHTVDAKGVEKALQGYESAPGGLPLEMYLNNLKSQEAHGFKFTTSEATGQNQPAASMSAHTKLATAGVHGGSTEFEKTLPNGNVSVVVVIMHK